jgi:lantibiotic biosynthesis protein
MSTTPPHTTAPAGWEQSLADGAPGVALLHIARARVGIAGWEPVHRLARAMTSKPVHAHPETTNLFQGAPAVAYALHTAEHSAYRTALATLDHNINSLIRRRLHAAHCRIDAGHLAKAREYDLINGLTGLGAYLLHRHGDHELLREIHAYLVRLTKPIHVEGRELPGWWAVGSPDRRLSPQWDGGHAGFGVAHGIAGPLALMSTAMRREVIVPGHSDSIGTICSWFDQWQKGQGRHTWWPEIISLDDGYVSVVTTYVGLPEWVARSLVANQYFNSRSDIASDVARHYRSWGAIAAPSAAGFA